MIYSIFTQPDSGNQPCSPIRGSNPSGETVKLYTGFEAQIQQFREEAEDINTDEASQKLSHILYKYKVFFAKDFPGLCVIRANDATGSGALHGDLWEF